MPTRIRNHVARSALLRKGGVHEKGRSANRQADKRELEQAVSEYFSHKKTATADDGSGRFSFVEIDPTYVTVQIAPVLYQFKAEARSV